MKTKLTLLLIIFIAIGNYSYSQTKKETEDWIVFYLSKYFSSDYSNDMLSKMKRSKTSFSYDTYSYQFVGGEFWITTSTYKCDSLYQEKMTKFITEHINLSKIIKIETEKSVSEFHFADFIRLIFNFKPAKTQTDFELDNLPIKKYDIKKKLITNGGSFEWGLTIQSNEQDAINSNLEKRMAKAFEKIAEFNEANLIKDIF